MPDPFARPLHIIDTDLHSTRTLQADAQRQLDEIRKRIAVLEQHELTLVAAIDGKARRFDRLLDERLRTQAIEPSQ